LNSIGSTAAVPLRPRWTLMVMTYAKSGAKYARVVAERTDFSDVPCGSCATQLVCSTENDVKVFDYPVSTSEILYRLYILRARTHRDTDARTHTDTDAQTEADTDTHRQAHARTHRDKHRQIQTYTHLMQATF
jgi:hypothetical protein